MFFHYAYDPVIADNRMEIDFLIVKSKVTNRRNVCPIEVKSATGCTTHSLDKFKRKYPGYVSRSIVLHPGDLRVEERSTYLPLYMASLVPKIA